VAVVIAMVSVAPVPDVFTLPNWSSTLAVNDVQSDPAVAVVGGSVVKTTLLAAAGVMVTETAALVVPAEPGFTVAVVVVDAVVVLVMPLMAIESALAPNVHAVAPAPPPGVIVATLEEPE
jgi:hypothetical protein